MRSSAAGPADVPPISCTCARRFHAICRELLTSVGSRRARSALRRCSGRSCQTRSSFARTGAAVQSGPVTQQTIRTSRSARTLKDQGLRSRYLAMPRASTHPDHAAEQAYIELVHRAEQDSRDRARRAPDAGADRFAAREARRQMLERFNEPIDADALCFGRIDLEGGETHYVGRGAVHGAEGELLVVLAHEGRGALLYGQPPGSPGPPASAALPARPPAAARDRRGRVRRRA